jgi:dTDP-4-dehydrorhamnose reductase
LVTGAAGMLGSELVPELAKAGHQLVVTDVDLRQRRPWGPKGPMLGNLDVRAQEDVQAAVTETRPDLVAHLAAETDLEACETDRDGAFHTNTLGTKFVALACRSAGVPMAYISTAGVFDGASEEPYTEFDTPSPINVYGRSKLEGEHLVKQFVPEHYIVRAGWMVGGGAKDHKFVARIITQLAVGRRTIYAVSDKVGAPTYAPDFAACFSRLLETESFGLYHMVCEGWGSRYDVAEHILNVLGRTDVELVDVDSSFFSERFFAPRPRSEVLRNLVLDLQGANTMRPWRIALQEYLLDNFAEVASSASLDPVVVSVSNHQPTSAVS